MSPAKKIKSFVILKKRKKKRGEHSIFILGECPCGVMVKAMDSEIIVSEFKLQLHYYVWERYEPPYPPSYGLNSTTTVLE